MLRATDLAQVIIRKILKPGNCVVDATVGNGHDTLFLAQCVGPSGRVYGFDIQEEALAKATQRLHGQNQVTLFHVGHEHFAEHLPSETKNQLAAVMFNLGYLPGATKDIVTQAKTTLAALKQALSYIKIGGVITIVLYPGHPGGAHEATAVRSQIKDLTEAFAVTQYARINSSRPAPELLTIQRLS